MTRRRQRTTSSSSFTIKIAAELPWGRTLLSKAAADKMSFNGVLARASVRAPTPTTRDTTRSPSYAGCSLSAVPRFLRFRLPPSSDSPFGARSLVLASKGESRGSVACRSSVGPGPGGSESQNVLDAFFLGKALAEALNERIESTVGEILSTLGRLQAEQQKQVQEFQEEVLERAKRAKEKAAREALEAQGLIPNSATPTNGSAVGSPPMSTSSPPRVDAVAVDLEVDISGKEGPVLGVSNDS